MKIAKQPKPHLVLLFLIFVGISGLLNNVPALILSGIILFILFIIDHIQWNAWKTCYFFRINYLVARDHIKKEINRQYPNEPEKEKDLLLRELMKLRTLMKPERKNRRNAKKC